jgi:hypothetical protein
VSAARVRALTGRVAWLSVGSLIVAAAAAAEPFELKLWPDGAPGSADWSVPETIGGADGNRVVTNVSDPTLTVYLPDPASANGTAVVIAPGGARSRQRRHPGCRMAERAWHRRLRAQVPSPATGG